MSFSFRRMIGRVIWYFVRFSPCYFVRISPQEYPKDMTIAAAINFNNIHISEEIRALKTSMAILKSRADRTDETIKTTAIDHELALSCLNRRISDIQHAPPLRGKDGRYVSRK